MMNVCIYAEVKIVGLGEADRLAVLQGCPGIPGAAGPKGKPGLSGTKGKIPKISDRFFVRRKICVGDTPYPQGSLEFFIANSQGK